MKAEGMQLVAVVYIIPMARFHAPARYPSRLGQRLQVALGAAAALAAISISPGSAQAYVVTVSGVKYDVTTFTGSYNNNISKFETAANGGVMPWWGSSSDATTFLAAVGKNLGIPNLPFYSAYFGYSYDPVYDAGGGPNASVQRTYSILPAGTIYDDYFRAFDTNAVWAQATPYTSDPNPVPAPLPLFGSAAALGFCSRLSRRSKRLRQGVTSRRA